jgi:integrase
MKNSPTGQQDRSAAWREALALFDADLRRRGMAEKTRRAYGVDLGQFALWCTTQGLDPTAVGPKDLRRYAAVLSGRDAVAATIGRKLASLRAFYRTLREHGQISQNPADLIPSPKRPRNLPKVLRPDELAALLDRIPASTPLELRDRALFEVAYACGLRAEELVNLDATSVDFDGEQLRVEGKGSKTRIVPAGEPALRALARYFERARPWRAGAVPVEVRPPPVDLRRAPPPAGVGAPCIDAGRHLPARPAPLVRDPSARGWSRSADHPGALGPCVHLNDADLHSSRVSSPEVRLCTEPPARVTCGDRWDGDQRQSD